MRSCGASGRYFMDCKPSIGTSSRWLDGYCARMASYRWRACRRSCNSDPWPMPAPGRDPSSRLKCLTSRRPWNYPSYIPEKNGIGFDSSNRQRRISATWRLFFVRCITSSPMSGGGGDTFGYAGFLCHRSVNLAICRSPCLTAGRPVSRTDIGDHLDQS